jgi:DNA adenine methylase
MWSALQIGWIPPLDIDKDIYKNIRENKESYPAEVVGWVGFGCSYSGKWFGGYAGKTNTKIGTIRDYILESHNAVMKQSLLLKDVIFTSKSYDEMNFVEKSIIYCDPPYEGTTKYKNDFDNTKFWEWCRIQAKAGQKVFISEYNAPDDFHCLWQKEVKSSLSANGKSGGSKNSVEKLFIFKNE